MNEKDWIDTAPYVIEDDTVATGKAAVREAVARGWCTPENSHKEMDFALAAAIVDQVMLSLPEIGGTSS